MATNRIQKLAAKLMADRVSLPEAQVGAFAIQHSQHKAGDKLMLVPLRVAMFSGAKQQSYVCPEPTVIHKLTEDDGVWMSDLPCELVQMHDELARHARGHVLIGGLGLGLVARMAARRETVSKVTVVESSPEVVQLVWPTMQEHLEGKGELLVGDINAVALPKCDTALLDTWQGTGEMIWTFDVVPLRRRLAHMGVRRVFCWQEQTMLGQINRAILGAAAVGSDHFASGACAPQYAFTRALEVAKVKRDMLPAKDGSSEREHLLELGRYEECRASNMANPQLRYLAWLLMTQVGSTEWERAFGEHWDAVTRYKNEPLIAAGGTP